MEQPLSDTEQRYVRGDALDVYIERSGLSEREVARRVYPDLSAEAAQQRLRRRRAADEMTVPAAEAEAIANALDTSPDYLDSLPAFSLELEGGPLAIGEIIPLYRERDEAVAASYFMERSGLFRRPEVVARTREEVEYLALVALDPQVPDTGHSPLVALSESAEILHPTLGPIPGGPRVDDLDVLLAIERYLRDGKEEAAGAAVGAFRPWMFAFLANAAHAVAQRRRRAAGAEADELGARSAALTDLAHQGLDRYIARTGSGEGLLRQWRPTHFREGV